MIKEAILKLVRDEALTEAESHDVANEIMEGLAAPSQIGAFITALGIRGERVEHVLGFVRTMRDKAVKIQTGKYDIILDTCGTGGDRAGTFNVSTAAAFIAAGAGIKVAKHGNRSVSSKCGSADVLKELGVNIDVSKEISERCLNEVGIAFLFAPLYHGAMKHAIQPRREVGIRTIFNIIGPLSNPAGTTHQLVGVFEKRLLRLFTEVLKELGSKRVLVVRGEDGLDEITTTTVTDVAELKETGEIKEYQIDPETFGFERVKINELVGGEAQANAQILESILRGSQGPKADCAILNAGAAIYVGEKAGSLEEGIKCAKEAVQSGTAIKKLEQLRTLTAKA